MIVPALCAGLLSACSDDQRSGPTTAAIPETRMTTATTPAATITAVTSTTSAMATEAPSNYPYETTAEPAVPSPDLGSFETADELVAALVASEPENNIGLMALANGSTVGGSICITAGTDAPTTGEFVHQATADLAGEGGVVFIHADPTGSKEVFMYSTGNADPVTGGCRLLLRVPYP